MCVVFTCRDDLLPKGFTLFEAFFSKQLTVIARVSSVKDRLAPVSTASAFYVVYWTSPIHFCFAFFPALLPPFLFVVGSFSFLLFCPSLSSHTHTSHSENVLYYYYYLPT